MSNSNVIDLGHLRAGHPDVFTSTWTITTGFVDQDVLLIPIVFGITMNAMSGHDYLQLLVACGHPNVSSPDPF